MKTESYKKRFLTAVVLIVPTGFFTYLGGLYFLFLMSVISLFAGAEIYRLFWPGGLNAHILPYLFFILLMLAGAHIGAEFFLSALYFSMMGVFATHLIKGRKDISGYLSEVGKSLIFITLLGTMTACAVLLRNIEIEISEGWKTVWFLKNEPGFFFTATAFICGALNDTAAYFAGKWKGRKKLVFNISPGKTVEGALAGIAASTAAGPLVNLAFGFPLPLQLACAFGLLAGFASILGDLVESAVKRNCNAKDSGALLPGHGGFFDRFDGMIFVFPAFYIFVRLLNF